MIKFLQKLKMLKQRSQIKTEVEMELKLVESYHADKLAKDEDELRNKLGMINNIKKPSKEQEKEKFMIQKELDEINQAKKMVQMCKMKINELTKLIEIIKKNLW